MRIQPLTKRGENGGMIYMKIGSNYMAYAIIGVAVVAAGMILAIDPIKNLSLTGPLLVGVTGTVAAFAVDSAGLVKL